jgi:hypothetical protein
MHHREKVRETLSFGPAWTIALIHVENWALPGGDGSGPRGCIPPMAGHHEAVVLSWVRVGTYFGRTD